MAENQKQEHEGPGHPAILLVLKTCPKDTESLARCPGEIKSNWELWSPNSMLNLFHALKIISNMSHYSAHCIPQRPGPGFPTIICVLQRWVVYSYKELHEVTAEYVLHDNLRVAQHTISLSPNKGTINNRNPFPENSSDPPKQESLPTALQSKEHNQVISFIRQSVGLSAHQDVSLIHHYIPST